MARIGNDIYISGPDYYQPGWKFSTVTKQFTAIVPPEGDYNILGGIDGHSMVYSEVFQKLIVIGGSYTESPSYYV